MISNIYIDFLTSEYVKKKMYGLSNFLKEYTRKYGNLASIDEDKFSYDNQGQDGSTSSRKQDQASGFGKFKPPKNCPTSYRTPTGNICGVPIKDETLVNSPINSETPASGSQNHESLTNSFINYEIPAKLSFNNQQENEGNGSCQIISEPNHTFPKSNGFENKYLEISNYVLIESKYEPPRLFENIDDQFDNFLAQCDRSVFINNMMDNSVPLVDIDKQIKHFSILHDKFVAEKRGKVINATEENYVKERVYLLAQQVYAKILAIYNKKGCRKKNKYYKKKNQKKNRKIGLFRY